MTSNNPMPRISFVVESGHYWPQAALLGCANSAHSRHNETANESTGDPPLGGAGDRGNPSASGALGQA
jgi:hypothetical protein